MDDMTKKIFARLDASMPGERVNAVDLFYDHLQKIGRTCRDILHEFEQAIPAQQFADLQKQHDKALQDNNAFAQRHQQDQQELAKLRREAAALKKLMWIRLNWRPAAGIAALLVVGWIGIHWVFNTPWPQYADGDLRAIARRVTWGQWFDKPFVGTIGGKSYWVLLRGDVDQTSYVDTTNNQIVMRCLHVYAAPADADSGQFYRPHPYSLFGFGWLQWPERLVDCQKSPDQMLGQK